ncbi:MAG: glycerol kinase [Cyclobacteriaceae bacterium]
MKRLSTTALAREIGFDSNELFKILSDKAWIYKKEGSWHLTKEGRMMGGDITYNPKYGEYITWPDNLDISSDPSYGETLSSTKIGEKFNLSAQKINRLFAEFGWIEKDQGGWIPTSLGKRNGAIKMEASSGQPYVVWSKSILNNSNFNNEVKSGEDIKPTQFSASEDNDDFRKKFPAQYRTADGHYVRSRAEVMIDDFLYKNEIVHAYERKVPIDEEMYCDFYILSKKVFIEYWGLEENEQYKERKKTKLNLYSKYGLELIEIFDKDVNNIDEALTTKLRKHNIIIH